MSNTFRGLNFTPALQADEALNDSDKTLTVPAGKEWVILSLWVELISDATVGDRQIEVQIQDDAADVVARFVAGAVQAASITRNYHFGKGVADLAAFRDTDLLTNPLPQDMILPAAYVVRIFDNNAVAAAADDMVVQMLVGERDVS